MDITVAENPFKEKQQQYTITRRLLNILLHHLSAVEAVVMLRQ